MSCGREMIWPPPGKSGPGSTASTSSSVALGWRISSFAASATSVRLCGGISVAMPTAMPEAPLSSTKGRRAGSSCGSVKAPS